MNKSELIDYIATYADVSKSTAARTLDAFIEATTSALSQGESVNLVKFGTFSVYERAERVLRNPATGLEMKVPVKKTPKFKASKILKDALQ